MEVWNEYEHAMTTNMTTTTTKETTMTVMIYCIHDEEFDNVCTYPDESDAVEDYDEDEPEEYLTNPSPSDNIIGVWDIAEINDLKTNNYKCCVTHLLI